MHEEEEGSQKKTLILGGLEDPETASTSLEVEEAGVVEEATEEEQAAEETLTTRASETS